MGVAYLVQLQYKIANPAILVEDNRIVQKIFLNAKIYFYLNLDAKNVAPIILFLYLLWILNNVYLANLIV